MEDTQVPFSLVKPVEEQEKAIKSDNDMRIIETGY